MKLSELIEILDKLASENPELLEKTVQIHFDTGCFSDAERVFVYEDTVVISEE